MQKLQVNHKEHCFCVTILHQISSGLHKRWRECNISQKRYYCVIYHYFTNKVLYLICHLNSHWINSNLKIFKQHYGYSTLHKIVLFGLQLICFSIYITLNNVSKCTLINLHISTSPINYSFIRYCPSKNKDIYIYNYTFLVFKKFYYT